VSSIIFGATQTLGPFGMGRSLALSALSHKLMHSDCDVRSTF